MHGSITADLPDLLPRIRAVVASLAARQDVDDLTQECCVRLIEKEHLWRPSRGGLRAWAAAVSRNVVRGFRPPRDSGVPAVDDLPAPAPELSEDQVRWVLEQFPRLPAPQREALRLRYFDGMTTVAIAARLGISQPAVSKRVAAGIAALRRRARGQGLVGALLPSLGVGKLQLAAGCGVVLLAVAGACFLPDPDTHLIAEAGDLDRTRVVAVLDAPLAADENVLWCATTPIAWGELRAVLDGPVRLAGDPPLAAALNASPVTAADVAERALVCGAGTLRDGIVERLQAALDERFGQGRDPVLDRVAAGLGDDGLLTYAFLGQDIAFAVPFETGERLETWFRWGEPRQARVRAFGIEVYDGRKERHRRLGAQVEVFDYRGRDDFVVRLRGRDDRQALLLAKVAPAATLRATVDAVRRRARAHEPAALADGDELRVPCLDFHLSHDHGELAGRAVANAGFESFRLERVLQTIRFRLNEEGARLRARTVGALEAMAPLEQKALVFDRPFLVLMQQEGADHPYFAAWVADPELLIPVE